MANANSVLILTGDESDNSLKSAFKAMDKFMCVLETLQVATVNIEHSKQH